MKGRATRKGLLKIITEEALPRLAFGKSKKGPPFLLEVEKHKRKRVVGNTHVSRGKRTKYSQSNKTHLRGGPASQSAIFNRGGEKGAAKKRVGENGGGSVKSLNQKKGPILCPYTLTTSSHSPVKVKEPKRGSPEWRTLKKTEKNRNRKEGDGLRRWRKNLPKVEQRGFSEHKVRQQTRSRVEGNYSKQQKGQ